MRFQQAVTVISSTFTVFTGFALNQAVTSAFKITDIQSFGDFHKLGDWHWGALIALIALLLRFIIGSTVHLNRTYVLPPATAPLPAGPPPQGVSQSVPMLLKDLAFLVLFGIAALLMTGGINRSDGLKELLIGGSVYLGFAILWSLVDTLVRDVWTLDHTGTATGPGPGTAVATTDYVGSRSDWWWLGLAAFQLIVTLVLLLLLLYTSTIDAVAAAWLLAVVYIACLYSDLKHILT